MSDLIPSELLMDILSRLAAEHLLRLRRVCKSWRRMIDDPYLTMIHQNRHDSHVFLLNQDSQFCTVSLDQLLNFDENNKEIEITHMNPYPVLNVYPHIASCNGLMLLSDYEGGVLWSIWNPFTRELHYLPIEEVQHICPPDDSCTLSSFGYDCVADDYKVFKVVAFSYPNTDSRVYYSLYSLKSDSWKRIEDFPFSDISSGGQIFLNGALNYIGTRLDTDRISIVAFNLETEDYRTYKLPFRIDGASNIKLGELGGCLSLSRSNYGKEKHFEIWLMNSYGVENTWTMLFSIAKTEYTYTLRALSYSKSKRLVLLERDNNTEFLLFNLENNTTKNIRIPRRLHNPSSVVLMTSLVRLNQPNRKLI